MSVAKIHFNHKKRVTRNHYTVEQKTQAVLEMLREEQTVAQIATKYGAYPTMLHKWKAQALEHLLRVFDSETQAVRNLEAEHDREREGLYAEIGRLTTKYVVGIYCLSFVGDEVRAGIMRNPLYI